MNPADVYDRAIELLAESKAGCEAVQALLDLADTHPNLDEEERLAIETLFPHVFPPTAPNLPTNPA